MTHHINIFIIFLLLNIFFRINRALFSLNEDKADKLNLT